MKNLKVVSNSKPQYSVKQISDKIKTDTWPDKQKYSVKDYLIEETPGVFVPNIEIIIQVRGVLYDIAYVNKQVTKQKNRPDKSKLLKGTVVYFPEEVKMNDDFIIPADSTWLIDGTHGTMIKFKLDIEEFDYNVVNFKEHLNSEVSKLKRLGNLLNVREDSKLECEDDSIKIEFYEMMDRNFKEGKDAKPTSEQYDDFLDAYEQINQETLSSWVSHHKEYGGRRKPLRPYTKLELEDRKTNLENKTAYDDYSVLSPYHLSNWDDNVLSAIWKQCHKEMQDKALVILYASNTRQQKQLEGDKMKNSIKKWYKETGEKYGLTIDVIFLPTK